MIKTQQKFHSRGIECLFAQCSELNGEKAKFFHRAIELLKRADTTFFELGPYPQPPDPNPSQQLNARGNVVASIICLHPLLEPSNPVWIEAGWKSGGEFVGGFGNGVLSDSFRIDSLTPMREDFPDFQEALQDRAERFLNLFEFLLPQVKPRFGRIDDVYGAEVTDKQVENAELKKLFWVTWFGPPYVEKHGKEFFLDAPIYQAKEFEDGVLVRVTERWWDFAENDQKEVIEYFRQKFPKIRANRCVI